jgi:hypothetical protein
VRVILEGVVGSTAYGLAGPNSDIDRMGIFQERTSNLLGIYPSDETKVTKDPDSTHHELGKFIRLAMAANPAVLELLYLEDYDELSPVGAELIRIRSAFLSRRVAQSYGGYAWQQFTRLKNRGDSFSSATRQRTSKHQRHMLRLLRQGRELLEHGTLTVRLPNPEEILAFGELPADEALARFEREYEDFRTIPCVLPDEPSRPLINAALLKFRSGYW